MLDRSMFTSTVPAPTALSDHAAAAAVELATPDRNAHVVGLEAGEGVGGSIWW